MIDSLTLYHYPFTLTHSTSFESPCNPHPNPPTTYPPPPLTPLSSGSADNTVKIWDVTTQACQHTFTHHTDKVQSVVWHYEEAWLLASGSFDKTVTPLHSTPCMTPLSLPPSFILESLYALYL